MRILFKVDTIENVGENWLVANFGMDEDGKEYILTTNYVHASEYGLVSDGAKGDCELVAALLNAYRNGLIELPECEHKNVSMAEDVSNTFLCDDCGKMTEAR